MKKIKFVFHSGLGNQLFMYALYLYLESHYKNIDLEPSLFPYKYLNPHNGFEIHKLFDEPKLTKAFDRLGTLPANGSSLKEPKYKQVIRILGDKMRGYKNITDSIILNVDSLNEVMKQHYRMQFVGFFQIPDFIQIILPVMRRKLRIIVWNGNNLKLINEMSGKITCSIHVRRGDYVGNPYFDIINYDLYYSQAINRITAMSPDTLFVLFSDDIDWAKNMLKIPSDNLKICDWNKGRDSYLDMFMMAECNHNILANSSFSYWGGVMNNHHDKIVIAPRMWAKNLNSEKIIQPGWILI